MSNINCINPPTTTSFFNLNFSTISCDTTPGVSQNSTWSIDNHIKLKSGTNLDIIGCQNCSTVLQRCVVPGRVWTDKGGDQPVHQGALATIRNAHHSHPQPLPVLPKTTSSAHNLRVLERVACRLPQVWKLFESLQDLPSLLSLTRTSCRKEEIPCGADARSDI